MALSHRRAVWTLLEAPTRTEIGVRARTLGGDGCTGVPDWYRVACDLHDILYRTHADLAGHPVSRAQADRVLRWAIQHESPLGRGSPLAWWRWAAVRLFGGQAWR